MDNQSPRYQIVPKVQGASDEVGSTAVTLAAEYGLTLDQWQGNVVKNWMRTGPDGRWCASTWAVSVPRQNGKNGSLEAVELYMMAVLGLKIVHTSHALSSARKAFKRLMRFFGQTKDDPNAEYPELNALVEEVRRTNSQESIVLTNGGLIELSARSANAARGSSYDVLVVDEAQEYEEDEQEALEPVVSASATGQPIIIYLGTPPKTIGLRGEPFVRVRNGAVTGKDKRVAWIEHSAHGELDKMSEPELAAFVHDRRNWLDANPGAPHRVTMETIEGEVGRWSPRSFARERLNMFPLPSAGAGHPFSEEMLEATITEADTSEWPLAAIGLDMNPERTKVTICMSYWSLDGQHLEIAADAPYDDAGQSALVEWIKQRAKWRIPVVVDAFSPARSLVPLIKKKKMKVFVLGAGEFSEACMGLHDAFRDEEVSTIYQEQLNLSLLGVVKEAMNKAGAWKFARESFDVDLGPAIATACAYFGGAKFGRRPSTDSESDKSPVGFF